jgi:8-oxo-dGTP pyrophosphatase MutT (NUDIX family)
MLEMVAAPHSPLPTDWRRRLQSRLLPFPDHALTGCRFGGAAFTTDATVLSRLHAMLPSELQPAAVLVPIVDRSQGPQVLLTERAGHLRHHAGQISLPGGRLEPDDADIAAAARRETEEETGIGAAFIETLGFMSDHVVQTGYRITPVVALVQPGFTLAPHRAEVADIFEVPLEVVVDSGSYRRQRRALRDVELDLWELPFEGRNVWGATAGILRHLLDLMTADPPPAAHPSSAAACPPEAGGPSASRPRE